MNNISGMINGFSCQLLMWCKTFSTNHQSIRLRGLNSYQTWVTFGRKFAQWLSISLADSNNMSLVKQATKRQMTSFTLSCLFGWQKIVWKKSTSIFLSKKFMMSWFWLPSEGEPNLMDSIIRQTFLNFKLCILFSYLLLW